MRGPTQPPKRDGCRPRELHSFGADTGAPSHGSTLDRPQSKFEIFEVLPTLTVTHMWELKTLVIIWSALHLQYSVTKYVGFNGA
jgi:hypothetical protein